MEHKQKYTISPQEVRSRHDEDTVPWNLASISDNGLQRAAASKSLTMSKYNVDRDNDPLGLRFPWTSKTEESFKPKMSTTISIDDGAVASTSGTQHKYVTKPEPEKWKNSPKMFPRDTTETKDIFGKEMLRNDKMIDAAKLSTINWDQTKRKKPIAAFYNTDESIDHTQMKFEVRSSDPKKEKKILDCTERYHWSSEAEIQELQIHKIKEKILREVKRIEEMTNTFTNFKNIQLATQSISIAIIELDILVHNISKRTKLKETNTQLMKEVIELKAKIALLEGGKIQDPHEKVYPPSFLSALTVLPRAWSNTGNAKESSVTCTTTSQVKKDPKISKPPVTIKDSHNKKNNKEAADYLSSILIAYPEFKKCFATKTPKTAVQKKKKNIKKAPCKKTTSQSKIASSRATQRSTSTKKKEEKKKATKSEAKKKKIPPHISTATTMKLLKDITALQKKLSYSMQCVTPNDSSDTED